MRCGFYETEITPPLGTTIFGYYGRRVNVGVKHKLFAKACVLEQDDKLCAMLDEHKTGAVNHGRKIWTVYTFLTWHKAFFGV